MGHATLVQRLAWALVFVAAGMRPAPAAGAATASHEQAMPFGQVVNLTALREVITAPPQSLMATLQRWGVTVMRVPSETPARAANPLLEDLPLADAGLLQRAEFKPGYDDPFRLLDPRWRRDIQAAQADVAADLHERIRFGQSQEAIAEKLLQRHIDAHSP